jgi:integrase
MSDKRKAPRAKGTGCIYRPKGTQFWWIAYYSGGRRRHESTESTRKGDAQRRLAERLGDKARGVVVGPEVGRLTFDDAAKAVITDFENNGKRSLAVVRRRIDKHLRPYFGELRMANITPAQVEEFKRKRKADVVVVRKARTKKGEDGAVVEVKAVTRPVSNAEINRELQVLKRMFSLAVQQRRLLHRPHVAMLREDNVRTGFFEPEQLASVLRHLPVEVQPVIRFAAITGWRVPSEVLPLEWRRVDMKAGEVRLDPGTTKNGEGRTFPFTAELRALLEDRDAERERLKKTGVITPHVFFRVIEGEDGEKPEVRPIVSFHRAWRTACRAAGCPGRIPHDLRRTAVRGLVRAGVPETVAMRLTGHKTRSVFDRYNIVSESDLRAAVRLLDNATATRRNA